ncbi:PREDICTED: YY1-associated factor 2 [Charadrius vociferus]|uniref:YY1-associated factor 2 n=1 Tax=Charadrius vociferus TaxID=50402 RepID=UPI000521B4E3|nr:PREDICTED: YY1-associated factor 2 [Charadrius vociferus]
MIFKHSGLGDGHAAEGLERDNQKDYSPVRDNICGWQLQFPLLIRNSSLQEWFLRDYNTSQHFVTISGSSVLLLTIGMDKSITVRVARGLLGAGRNPRLFRGRNCRLAELRPYGSAHLCVSPTSQEDLFPAPPSESSRWITWFSCVCRWFFEYRGLNLISVLLQQIYICAHRKPRPVSQLVAQQVPQQFVPPTQSKKEKKDKVEKEKSEKETTSKKNSHKKTRPRLKNVDRSSAQHLEVTVGDLTVIITDFKEKTKSPPASSAASADQHSQSGSSSDNTERGMSRSSSPRGEASSLNGESH